jgi:dienelactone hydrolase
MGVFWQGAFWQGASWVEARFQPGFLAAEPASGGCFYSREIEMRTGWISAKQGLMLARMKTLLAAIFGLCFVLMASAQVHVQSVPYRDGDTILEGYLTFDDSIIKGKRPGVLLAHQWMGLGAYEKKRAEMLAKLGYNVFCVDIYGKGVRPQDTKEAGTMAGKYKADRDMLRRRMAAGLEVLQKNELTDPKKVAAIGYCFGGTAVLELARSGADIAGVVTFHGGLDSPKPDDGKNIKCKVLALHGADDPNVTAKDLAAFEDEMRKGRVDWQLLKYGGAVHSFTDWNAGNDNSRGAAYNESADKRSWEDMKQFFAEIFH